ncbi:MAG: hypothetical protein WKF84_28360 [Pyrinomonadaceae bacterium]
MVYSSRMTNRSGGRRRSYYYSNAGMLNLDTNKVTPEGGLQETPREADEHAAEPWLERCRSRRSVES